MIVQNKYQIKPPLPFVPGADGVINYSAGDLRESIKTACTALGSKAPDVIHDPVGGEFAEPAFRSIAWRGRYLVVGFASGSMPALLLKLALLKGASIVGVFWGEYARLLGTFPTWILDSLLFLL